jgi:putative nucleotidyltransferase with HDIG domain
MTSLLAQIPLAAQIREILPQPEQLYLVGGAVRDALLSRPIHDLDFVLPGAAISAGRKVANALGGDFYALDAERDTGRVILRLSEGERLILDFAAFRGPDLESDLRGRDFTVNALALDLHRPETLIDPLNGAEDLRERRLRVCSPASLIADPVRILRGARLAVDFELRILPETKRLLQEAIPLLSSITPERMRDELFKILDGKAPVAALRILDHLGVINSMLPELAAMKGEEQSAPHVYDVWEHTLHTVEYLANLLRVLQPQHDPETTANWTMGFVSLRLGRFRQNLQQHLTKQLNPERTLRSLLLLAALYHDVGKPVTAQRTSDGSVRFLKHDEAGSQIARARSQAYRLSNLEGERLEMIVRHHLRPLLLSKSPGLPSRRAIYRFFRDVGPAGVDICLLSLADVQATYASSLPQAVWMRHMDVIRALLEAWWEQKADQVSPPPLISGNDLMEILGLKPGPQIGQLLEEIREAQASGEVSDRASAIEFARKHLQ